MLTEFIDLSNSEKNIYFKDENDVIQGVQKVYDKNNNLTIEAIFKNGKLNGIFKCVFKNNVFSHIETMKEGSVNGVVIINFNNPC